MSIRNIRAMMVAGVIFATTIVSSPLIMAQSKLQQIDQSAAQLLSLADENKYEYDRVQWLQDALHAVENASVQEVDTFVPQTLGKLSLPSISATIIYYFHPEGNNGTLCWIAQRTDPKSGKRQTNAFVDNIDGIARHLKRSTKPNSQIHLRQLAKGQMIGFELTDTLNGRPLWLMPDLPLRMDMETMADINASDADKEQAQQLVQQRLRLFIADEDALTADLSGLPHLYSLISKNKRVRILTYMNVFGNMTSRCSGFVLRRNGKGATDIFDLTDYTQDIRTPERFKATNNKWYGAIYYDMVEVNIKRTTYYTLLGYKGTDGVVKTRVIEPLWFDGKKCKFGAPIFHHEKANYIRRIFQYSADATMMLRWDEKRKSIVFDHLSPHNPIYVGEYRFYGPDFSYDGYEKGNKYWIFREDLELRNERKVGL